MRSLEALQEVPRVGSTRDRRHGAPEGRQFTLAMQLHAGRITTGSLDLDPRGTTVLDRENVR
jgi:hypothetical protein